MDTTFVVVGDPFLAVAASPGWTMTTIVDALRTMASTVSLVLLGICAVFATHHGDLTVRKFFSYMAVASASALYKARSTTNNNVSIGLVLLALALLVSSYVLPLSSSWRDGSRRIQFS